MSISVFNVFQIGVGPSSACTVGPMRAANRFSSELRHSGVLNHVSRVSIDLFGTLAATAFEQRTDDAVLLGLSGEEPETLESESAAKILKGIVDSGKLSLLQKHVLPFSITTDIHYFPHELIDEHSIALRFTAYNKANEAVHQREFCVASAGTIRDVAMLADEGEHMQPLSLPNNVTNIQSLCRLAEEKDSRVSELILENECFWRSEQEVRGDLLGVWQIIRDCIRRGLDGTPALNTDSGEKRIAPGLHEKLLLDQRQRSISPPINAMAWVNLYALSVAEENARGGRIVSAPTNEHAGVVSAVLHYFNRFTNRAGEKSIIDFLLTAGSVGSLLSQNRINSNAEGEELDDLGIACAMAAAGLSEALGGSPTQIENATKIAINDHLGLKQLSSNDLCAMAAMKAINASFIAMNGYSEQTTNDRNQTMNVEGFSLRAS